MKKIALSQGKYALIDDDDFELVSNYGWVYDSGGFGYARGKLRIGRYGLRRGVKRFSGKRVRMHRLIMNPPQGVEIDHINGDGLDNRRCNLRLATRAQQAHNMRKHRHSKSPYKGVEALPYGRWRAGIRINGKALHLGCFASAEDAARVYDAAAIEHFGEFARPNFPGWEQLKAMVPEGVIAE